ncbi:hypothetical protein [Cellulophaga fucicola]|uniref:hypothetical protein n=1 Tax=Cellulophaga fucicola TaxID=76595 RepID=UPI003EBB33AD
MSYEDELKISEAATKDTYPGLLLYYRDCDLYSGLIAKYKVNQVIKEKGLTDVSSFAEGLGKNLRFAIASNKAIDMAKINPDVAKYGFNLIKQPSYYKVLDVYTVGDKTQITLLNFNVEFVNYTKNTTKSIDKEIVKLARNRFDRYLKMKPNEFLYDDNWLARTKFPIGMSDYGLFFNPENE